MFDMYYRFALSIWLNFQEQKDATRFIIHRNSWSIFNKPGSFHSIRHVLLVVLFVNHISYSEIVIQTTYCRYNNLNIICSVAC